jgi:hypothetical protein
MELCPCRNRVLDVDVWREVFRTARKGDHRARERAADAIATMLHKVQTSPKWRELLKELDSELEITVRDHKAYRHLIGQITHQAGHARTLKGTGIKTLRHQRRVLDLTSPQQLATWVSNHLGLEKHEGISKRDPGVDRLWRWVTHLTEFQKRRRSINENELLQKAAQWLPRHFDSLMRAG